MMRPMVCPECGEPAQNKPPDRWTPASGERPQWSHTDGEPLCPVDSGGAKGHSVPAHPVPAE